MPHFLRSKKGAAEALAAEGGERGAVVASGAATAIHFFLMAWNTNKINTLLTDRNTDFIHPLILLPYRENMFNPHFLILTCSPSFAALRMSYRFFLIILALLTAKWLKIKNKM
jgi:hypothetical protein